MKFIQEAGEIEGVSSDFSAENLDTEKESKKQSLSKKIDFICGLDKNKEWINDPNLVEKFFSDGEDLLSNTEFIEIEMHNYDNFADIIGDFCYVFDHKQNAILLEYAIKYKDKFPNIAQHLIFTYKLIFLITPYVLESESLVKLLLQNIKDESLYPIIDKFIMVVFDERVKSNALELIKRFESGGESILDRGIFIDLVNAKVESHLFDFQYLQNIKKILEEIIESSDVSYFLKIKCRATLSKIESILESQTEDEYDNETERIISGLFESESELEEGDDIVSTSGFNFSAEYRLIMANMPGFILPQEQKESEEWNYLKKTCRKEIEKDFGELFFDISPQEQKLFLDFVKKKKDFNIGEVRIFCKKYKRNGFLTFLSLEHGRDFGNSILKIGEKLPDESARKVFEKYSEFIDQLGKVENVLEESYGKETDTEEVSKIKEALLKKGKDLLVHFADMIAEGKEISTEEILAYLDRIEIEATTFFLTFKTLKEEKQLPPLEEIKGISFQRQNSAEVSLEDKEAMRKLYEKNYKDDPAFLAELLQKFEERASDPTTRFYILKYLGKLKASIAFTPDKEREGVLYGHSFNVEPSLRGISIGNTMLEKAKDQEAKDHILTSDCAAFLPIGAKNIETGYVARRFYEYKGHPSLFVERNDRENKKYWGKQMVGREKEIIELFETEKLPENVKIETGIEQDNISMNLISQGYLLTRYFRDEESKKWFAVFERI